jgi:uncharacterized protein
MIERHYRKLVEGKLNRYPAVVLTGPRQCGKTTLARSLGGRYFDMESETGYLQLDARWHELCEADGLVIIDEAQERPEVFRRLRGEIDAQRKRNGRFLLLGSVAPALSRNLGESLAGRVGFVEMGPMSLLELATTELDRLWLCGGYPDGGILEAAMFPEWQQDYLSALVSRDLPNWGLPAKPRQTERLLAMIAALNGQSLNLSSLANSLGVDAKTVGSYIDFLEGAFLVRRLPAYSANLKKRLVKAPHIFIRDSGLLHALLRVRDRDTLFSQPWVGHSWESFVIEQTLSALRIACNEPETFYLRTSDGYEIDLVLQWGTRRWAVEVKLTSEPSADQVRRLQKTAGMIGAERSILLCRTGKPVLHGPTWVVDPLTWCESLVNGGPLHGNREP